MPTAIELSPWPVSLNNVAWSADSVVAVAVAANVSLLIPRRQQDGNGAVEWFVVDLPAGVFTDTEAPLLTPGTWSAFSTGEELSERHVSAIQWSPPGLGKHKTCALAVLTSNHTLSIWECIGRPDNKDDWKRAAIINNVIKDLQIPFTQRKRNPAAAVDRAKRASRIQSFCWCPIPGDLEVGITGSSPPVTHALAVSNDDGDIIILKVQSPYDILHPSRRDWEFSIVCSFRAVPEEISESSIITCLPSHAQRRPPLLEALAWSPWHLGGDRVLTSTVAFTSRAKLHTFRVRALNIGSSLNLDVELPAVLALPELPDEVVGPMSWMPTMSSSGETILVFFGHNTICSLAVSPCAGIHLSTLPLQNQWQRISALSFSRTASGEPTVTFAYHMDPLRMASLVYQLPLKPPSTKRTPAWQSDLEEAQIAFSNRHEQAGNVLRRVFGLAHSSNGDLAATSSSLHPRNGFEYVILGHQYGVVTISREHFRSFAELFPNHRQDVPSIVLSADTIYLSLQHYFEIRPEHETNNDDMVAQILRTSGMSEVMPTENPNSEHSKDITTTLAERLKRHVLLEPACFLSRSKLLVDIAQNARASKKTPDLDIIGRLVKEVLGLSLLLPTQDPLSSAIARIYRVIHSKVEERQGRTSDVFSTIGHNNDEVCTLCDEAIIFESLRWSRCSNGHQHSRCGLSFLTIASPSKIKNCGICRQVYLNEFVIEGLNEDTNQRNANTEEMGSTNMQGTTLQMSEPLARVMFAACDFCIYCGGRFVG